MDTSPLPCCTWSLVGGGLRIIFLPQGHVQCAWRRALQCHLSVRAISSLTGTRRPLRGKRQGLAAAECLVWWRRRCQHSAIRAVRRRARGLWVWRGSPLPFGGLGSGVHGRSPGEVMPPPNFEEDGQVERRGTGISGGEYQRGLWGHVAVTKEPCKVSSRSPMPWGRPTGALLSSDSGIQPSPSAQATISTRDFWGLCSRERERRTRAGSYVPSHRKERGHCCSHIIDQAVTWSSHVARESGK